MIKNFPAPTRPYSVYADNGSWILWAVSSGAAIRIARMDCGAVGRVVATERLH